MCWSRTASSERSQAHGPRLMCFRLVLDLPMVEIAESGWNPNPSRANHKYFPFLFCNEAGFVMFVRSRIEHSPPGAAASC